MARSREVAATVGLIPAFTATLVGFTSWNWPVNARTLGAFAIGNVIAITARLLVVWSFRTDAFGEPGALERAALAGGAVFLISACSLPPASSTVRVARSQRRGRGRLARTMPAPVVQRGRDGGLGAGACPARGRRASGSISPTNALAGTGVLLVEGSVFTIAVWRVMDELMRRLSTEAGNISYYLFALIGGGWATLARLEFVTAPAPLDWLTMLTGLVLAARRGLMAQR